MSDQCASNLNSTLQASIHNQFYKLLLEFYSKYENQYKFLSNAATKVLIEECIRKDKIDISNASLSLDSTNLEESINQLKHFCK